MPKTIHQLTADGSPADADEMEGQKSPFGAGSSVRWTWTAIKAFLKTYFDGLYGPSVTISASKPVNSAKAAGSVTVGSIAVPGVSASGTITFSSRGTIGRGVMIGATNYTADGATGLLRYPTGITAADSANNLAAAINGTDGANTPNTDVTAVSDGVNKVTVTAIQPGTAGNSIGLSTNDPSVSVSDTHLTGGTDNTYNNVADGNTVQIGSQVYTFRDTPTLPADIQVGANAPASATNLKNGVNALPDTNVVASGPGGAQGLTVTLTAITAGAAGNSITIAIVGANLAKTDMANGVDATAGAVGSLYVYDTGFRHAGGGVTGYPGAIYVKTSSVENEWIGAYLDDNALLTNFYGS